MCLCVRRTCTEDHGLGVEDAELAGGGAREQEDVAADHLGAVVGTDETRRRQLQRLGRQLILHRVHLRTELEKGREGLSNLSDLVAEPRKQQMESGGE
eukprot:2233434-Pleurochrysis_carterae.AAC.2